MAHVQLLGVVHAITLMAFSWQSASRLIAGGIRRFSACFLLIWANLVCTAFALSVFSALGSMVLYFLTSLAIAAGVDWLLRRRVTPLPQKEPMEPDVSRFDRAVTVTLAAALAVAVVACIAVCVHYLPNNWDSCAYRFSRPFFYLARGNLLHFPTGDPRLIYYPSNGALFYLFFAVYQYPARAMYVVTWLAWIFAGIGAYSISRNLGASRRGSFIAAWICMMAPNMIAQVGGTNDEVLAATPILLALSFAADWFKTPSRRLALLAGLGIGLGCGTKLHWMFYSIAALLATGVMLYLLIRKSAVRAVVVERWPDFIVAACAVLPLAGAFMLCNYISSGHVTNSQFNDQVLNKPFRVSLAAEKILTNSSHLFLSPVPDLMPPIHREQTAAAYDRFNNFINRCCLTRVVQARIPSPAGYMFRGPTEPNAFDYTEYTVWLGFLPHLLLLICVVGLVTRSLSPACIALAASFCLWHFTYSISTIYIGGVGVYYSFPGVIAAGAFGPAWDWVRSSRRPIQHVVLGSFLCVFAAQAVLDANLLSFGWLRNLQFLWKSGQMGDKHAVSPTLVDSLQSARSVYIPSAHWEVLYWNFMRHNPAARYTTGLQFTSPSPDTLMLISIAPSLGGFLIPARLPAKTATALTYLGEADAAPIFATGNHVDTVYPLRTGYMLLPLTRVPGGGKNPVTGLQPMTVCCVGLKPSDRIEYRYGVEASAGGASLYQEWHQNGQPDKGLSWGVDNPYDVLVIETRSSQDREAVVRTEQTLAGNNYYVGANEQSYSGRRPLTASIPARVLEPWRENGQEFKVSWLGRETSIRVSNPGDRTHATLELRLATFGKDHTAILLANGVPAGTESHVNLFTPVPTAPVVRFPVTLLPGENHFVLTSKESPDLLPGGRPVCFLLIGDIAISTAPEPAAAR